MHTNPHLSYLQIFNMCDVKKKLIVSVLYFRILYCIFLPTKKCNAISF